MSHKPTERVIQILLSLSSTNTGLTLSEISNITQIPKGTLSPILVELTEANFITYSKDSRLYSLGLALVTLATSQSLIYTSTKELQQAMRKLSDMTNEVCQLGILNGENVLYLYKEEPSNFDLTSNKIKIISHVGIKLPTYATALGKALLSTLPDEKISSYLPNTLQKITPNTITNLKDLLEQIHTIRNSHIATESEEITPYLTCFATPIKISNTITVAVSISAPLFRMTLEKQKLIQDQLLSLRNQFNINE